MFDEIKDYPKGFRVFSNVFRTHARAAASLGLPDTLSGVGLLNAWRERIREKKPIAPVTVKDGPVFENRAEGAALDLGIFPAPIWH